MCLSLRLAFSARFADRYFSFNTRGHARRFRCRGRIAGAATPLRYYRPPRGADLRLGRAAFFSASSILHFATRIMRLRAIEYHTSPRVYSPGRDCRRRHSIEDIDVGRAALLRSQHTRAAPNILTRRDCFIAHCYWPCRRRQPSLQVACFRQFCIIWRRFLRRAFHATRKALPPYETVSSFSFRAAFHFTAIPFYYKADDMRAPPAQHFIYRCR